MLMKEGRYVVIPARLSYFGRKLNAVMLLAGDPCRFFSMLISVGLSAIGVTFQ
jgi:hypothetical protein